MRLADPKRLIPLIVALLAGLVTLGSYIQPNALSSGLFDVAAGLTAAGLLLGVLNVLNVHRQRIVGRAVGWPYSIVLVTALVTTFVLAVLPTIGPGLSRAIFLYVYRPLAGSILALLTFFALRAAWRALQLRPGEASIILGVAIVFLLANGPWTALVPGLASVLTWIREYPVLGVARGLLLGVGIGALVASVRVLLGLDQPYLDR